jgi:hypothetical protein
LQRLEKQREQTERDQREREREQKSYDHVFTADKMTTNKDRPMTDDDFW